MFNNINKLTVLKAFVATLAVCGIVVAVVLLWPTSLGEENPMGGMSLETAAASGLPPAVIPLPPPEAEPYEPYEPEPEPEPFVPPTARLAFVGDAMKHLEQLNAARVSPGVYDFNYAFYYIAPYIQSADWAIANLETTLVHDRFAGWPLFRSPRAYAEALFNAGFDYVTTGNNHSFDAFAPGIRSTIEILNDIGMGFTGTYLTPECREVVTVVEVNGFTFALLNHTMHMNGLNFTGYEHMFRIIYHDLVEQSRIDYDMILEHIAMAKALEPDFIIALPHIGLEYYGTMNRVHMHGHQWDTFDRNDGRWVNWMRTLHFYLDNGVDIIMSHHPHTLLPAEFVYFRNDDGTYRQTFIAYSMANFVSAQRTQPRETSAVFYLDFIRDECGTARIAGASYTPIWVQNRTFTVFPVTSSLRRVNAGLPHPFSDAEIARLRVVHNDVTHMLSGEPIPLAQMQDEYEITRRRYREQFPGLPQWGTLPWR